MFFGLFVVNIKENFDNHEEDEEEEQLYMEEEEQLYMDENNITPEINITPKINYINIENSKVISEESYDKHYQEEEHLEIIPKSEIYDIVLPISFSLRLPIEMSTNINLNNIRDSTIKLLTSSPINLSNQFIENISFRSGSGSIIIDIALNIDSDETYNKIKQLEKENKLFLIVNGMKFKLEVFKPSTNIIEVDPRRPNLNDCPTETDPVCCLEPYNSNNYPYKTHKNMCIAKSKGALENYCKIGKCDEKHNWENTINSWKHNHTSHDHTSHDHTSHDHTHYYDWEKDLDKLNNVHNKTLKDGNSDIIQANLKGVSSIFAPNISISD